MAETTTTNNIIDLDLSAIRRQRIRIDGDDNRILELNTSDLSIVNRLSESYPKLDALDEKVGKISEGISDEDSDEDMKTIAERLAEVDSEMRGILDYIFDTNVSEVCAPHGSMYDPIDGKLRYEHIIEAITNLYSESLSKEMKKVQNRTKSHTAKYTGKK